MPASNLKRIGPYVVVRELGRGATAQVFLCQHEQLGLQHAVKVLFEGAAGEESMLARFQQEMALLSQIQHPGIVRIHSAGIHQGRPYFAMDFLEGPTLRTMIKQGLPPEEALDLLEELALTLGHLHKRGLVHRDVKPANVLVVNGHPHLADFGLAKLLGVRSQRLTLTGEIVGTPAYMSPEQVDSSRGHLGPPCDVFALGAILYEVYQGSPPFHAATNTEVYLRLLESEAPPLSSEGVSAELRAVCAKALATDPSQRYQDARAFYADLVHARYPQIEELPPRSSSRAGFGVALALLLATGLGVLLGAWAVPTSGVVSPQPSTSQLVAATPSAQATTPGSVSQRQDDLVPLDRVPRLTAQQLHQGTLITASPTEEAQRYLGTIVGDQGDQGYRILYAHGRTEVARPPPTGFLPDLFLPGTTVEAQRPREKEYTGGTIVRRQGPVALVELQSGERYWLSLGHLRLPEGLELVGAGEPEAGGPAFLGLYKATYYVGIELERRGGQVRVLWLEDGTQDWCQARDSLPLPPPGTTVEARPFGAKDRVVAEVESVLNDMAVLLRLESGAPQWITPGQFVVRKQ